MNVFKKICFKTIAILMITIQLSFFFVATPVEAKIKLKDGEFYYSGTQSGEMSIDNSSIWSKIAKTIGDVANYLFGFITLGFRGVIIGWIEIFEMLLTQILTLNDNIEIINDDAMMEYSQKYINVESIIFNRVRLLDANLFSDKEFVVNENDTTGNVENGEENIGQTTSGVSSTDSVQTTSKVSNIVSLIRKNVATWYYIMRFLAIAFMLVLLIYIGIRLAILSVSSEKALYKQMLIGWISGMILIFAMHYIMIAILNLNEAIITALEPATKTQNVAEYLEEYEFGEEKNIKTPSEIETSLYESARTRAYSLNFTDGFTGMMFYALLVYYAWRFAIVYLRRVLILILLTLMAPAVAVSFAFNKALTGKSPTFSRWLNEYIMNTIIQIVHVILYSAFAAIALTLSLQSITSLILAIVLFNFMLKASEMLRNFFGLSTGLVNDMTQRTSLKDIRDDFRSATNALLGGQMIKGATKFAYNATTAPVKAGFGYALGKVMENKKNKQFDSSENNDDNNENSEQTNNTENSNMRNEANKEDDLAKYKRLTNFEERFNKVVELEGELNELQEKENLTVEEKYRKKKLEDELEIMMKEEESFVKRFLAGEVREENTNRKIFKRARANIFDPENYVEPVIDKEGNIKYKSIGTKYNSGNTYIDSKGRERRISMMNKILSGKKNSVYDVFKSSLSLSVLLGFNDDSKEYKKLKEDKKFLKESVKGILSSYAAIPAFAINPLLGTILFQKGVVARSNITSHILQNKSSYEAGMTYNTTGEIDPDKHDVDEYTYWVMKENEEQMFRKKHKIISKIINNDSHVVGKVIRKGVEFSGIAVGAHDLGEIHNIKALKGKKRTYRAKHGAGMLVENDEKRFYSQKNARKTFENLQKMMIDEEANLYAQDYDEMFNGAGGIRDNVRNDVDNISRRSNEISFEDIRFGASAVIEDRNNGIFYQINRNNGDEKIIANVENYIFSSNPQEALNYIEGKKEEIVKSSVTKWCVSNGITNISNVNLDSAMKKEDITVIKKEFFTTLEKRGVIEKGAVSPENVGIDDSYVFNVAIEMKNNAVVSNRDIKMERQFRDKVRDVESLVGHDVEVKTDAHVKKIKKEDIINQGVTGQTADVVSDLQGNSSNQEGKANRVVLDDKILAKAETRRINLIKQEMEKKAYISTEKSARFNAYFGTKDNSEKRDKRHISDEDEYGNEEIQEKKEKLLGILFMLSELNKQKQKIEHKRKIITAEDKYYMKIYGVNDSEDLDLGIKLHGSSRDVIKLINKVN